MQWDPLVDELLWGYPLFVRILDFWRELPPIAPLEELALPLVSGPLAYNGINKSLQTPFGVASFATGRLRETPSSFRWRRWAVSVLPVDGYLPAFWKAPMQVLSTNGSPTIHAKMNPCSSEASLIFTFTTGFSPQEGGIHEKRHAKVEGHHREAGDNPCLSPPQTKSHDPQLPLASEASLPPSGPRPRAGAHGVALSQVGLTRLVSKWSQDLGDSLFGWFWMVLDGLKGNQQ